MQLISLLSVAGLLASTATATTFNNFRDLSCQVWNKTYVSVSKTDLENLVKDKYATTPTFSQSSRLFFTDAEKKKCPPNSDDTYKWVCSHIIFPCYAHWPLLTMFRLMSPSGTRDTPRGLDTAQLLLSSTTRRRILTTYAVTWVMFRLAATLVYA